MVLLAFSLQDQVEKYGAYVGLAAFFGLAVLTLLYFAQAREVKRLREWAGRAPERAAELEQAVAAHAEEVRRAPTPVPAPQPVAAPQPVPAAANGAVTLKPAEVAALAFARAAGVHTPHVPTPHPVPAAAAVATAASTQVASTGAAVTTDEPAGAPASNGGTAAHPPVPAPATPAARRADPPPPPPPLPPRRPPPTRRPSPPPRRESNARAVVLTAIIGVLVLAGAAFGATRLFGGDEAPKEPNVVPRATEDAQATATAAAAPTKETALVGVYNGTGSTGLAAQFRDLLLREGYPGGNLGVDTAPPEQQRQTSVVMYRRGARPAAQGVATALDISDVQTLDTDTQALVAKAQKSWDVVVIVGADKSQ